MIIAQERSEAERAVHSLGPRLVIEEFLTGEEVSFIVLCDGKTALPLEATQDHKTVGDGDTGPNTGGMGAYCDGRIFSQAQIDHVMDAVIQPVIAANQFTGFLYAGLMMTASGPKVLEFNVRLGDPETQPLMHRMEDGFGEALMRAATGTLNGAELEWKPEPSVCVVLAAHGYPGQVRTGDLITGIEDCGAEVFQAGTRMGARGRDRRRASAGRHGLRIRFARGRREHLRGCRQDPFRRHALPPRHRAQGIQTLGLNVVGTGRFELPTCRLGGDRSIHLSYVPETTIVSSIGSPMEISTFRCGKIASASPVCYS